MNNLEKENKKLKALIEEALHPGVFGYQDKNFDYLVGATNIENICKQCGYGAVMSHVQHLWQQKSGYDGSEHTVAACALVRREWCEKASKLISKINKTEKPDIISKKFKSHLKKVSKKVSN